MSYQHSPPSSPGIAVRRTASLRSPMTRRSRLGEHRTSLIEITGSRAFGAAR